jgi:hypothetical protein
MANKEYHGKVADQYKALRDHFQEQAEKKSVDPVIREHVKSDLDTLVEKNEKLSK